MKTVAKWLGIALVVLLIVFFLGPREDQDTTVAFKPNAIDADVEAYLAKAEAGMSDIIPGAQKQIIWADPVTKSKTPWSVVYIHGFSATLAEIRPVPDMVAKELGANLFYTRLAGHGISNVEGMADGSLSRWMNDVAETLAIGRATGERVLVIATSTGGTLATIAAEKPALMKNVQGLAMVAPNFAVKAAGSSVLAMPWARQLLPKVFGDYREWEPRNDGQAKWWSTRYPNVALLPMQASVNAAAEVRYEDLSVPALFIYHPEDGVVDHTVTKEVVKRWANNSDAKAETFEVKESEDTMKHVVAGDILDPKNTKPVADKITAWAKSL